ncbi:MAG: peptide ABC transporter substrate-binding protein [Bacteroidetes bacterium]|nr:peptide ABC transporter substrate-binding protein [Bacteroidota bacterium]
MSIIKNTIYVAVLGLCFFACKSPDAVDTRKKSANSGGIFRIAENTQISTIYPHMMTGQVEGLVASQIHECLTRLDVHSMKVIPGLAESWETSADGKTVTFHLRKGARFQRDKCFGDGPGPEVTAKDVKYTLELLCTQSDKNYHFATVLKDRVVGANEYFEQSKNAKPAGLKGFKLIDDHTFSLELTHPSQTFLHILANPVASILNEKAVSTYGTNCKVGAGPFMYSAASTADHIVLVKNPDYFGVDSAGFALPYLDTVSLTIYPGIEDGLMEFEKGRVDLVNALPSGRIKEVVEKNIQGFESHPAKFILDRKPEMISQYYSFNLKRAPFDNAKVRQAINYAINRDKIVDAVLQGQAYGPGIYGITPNTFPGYDITKIEGYSFNPEKAKKLLAEAGFPGGIGFPSVNVLVNSGSSRNSSVIAEIQKQLKDVLNLNVSFESLPNGQKYDLEMHGKGDIYRDAWVADYPSPESFLMLFVGESVPADNNAASFPNTCRYQNPEYDMYYKKGRDSNNKDSCYAYFMKAEQILVKDAPIIPLWYEGAYRLISNNISGFYSNPMRYYDLTRVYVKKQ